MYTEEKKYWDKHYCLGGVSGEGSIGYLRDWKWKVITEHLPKIEHVIDVGCGDLSFWEGRDCQDYTGIDISPTIITNNKTLRPQNTFIISPAEERIEHLHKDNVFCFDLLFHIMNTDRFKAILGNLCYYSTNYIFIYNWYKSPWASKPKRSLVIMLVYPLRQFHFKQAWFTFFSMLGISHNDGRYQYFRSLNDHLQIFEQNGFKLIDTREYTDGIGALYVFKKRA